MIKNRGNNGRRSQHLFACWINFQFSTILHTFCCVLFAFLLLGFFLEISVYLGYVLLPIGKRACINVIYSIFASIVVTHNL